MALTRFQPCFSKACTSRGRDFHVRDVMSGAPLSRVETTTRKDVEARSCSFEILRKVKSHLKWYTYHHSRYVTSPSKLLSQMEQEKRVEHNNLEVHLVCPHIMICVSGSTAHF